MWNILNVVKRGSYLNALVPDHPNATVNGYVLLHRVIMENHIGRLLTSNEEVHHIDLNPFNNDVSNLSVVSPEEHRRIHSMYRWRSVLEICCPWCNSHFLRNKSQTHLSKPGQTYTSCSRYCSGAFNRYIQLNGFNPEVVKRINLNIQGEYKENFISKEIFEV